MTGLYFDANPQRQAEFLECVRRNAENHNISRVLVFVEAKADLAALSATHSQLASTKVTLIEHGRRLTYRDLFDYANTHLVGSRLILANADIFFDHSLARLAGYELTGKLLCLSRWDFEPNGASCFFDHSTSQDAWIFSSPMPHVQCHFPLGVPGCDNRLAWEAARAGLVVSNPARSIRAHHLHLTAVRRYSERERLHGPTLPVPAGVLDYPWLWFVIPCKGRLEDLKQCLAVVAQEPSSTCVVVDYACSEDSGAWVREHYPQVSVVACSNRSRFCGADARNRGAALAEDDGLICFIDADIVARRGFAKNVLTSYLPGTFLVPDSDRTGLENLLVCRRRDLERVGGFDEAITDYGEEVLDLRESLLRSGLKEATFASSWLSHRPLHAALLLDRERQRSLVLQKAYRRAKAAALEPHPNGNAQATCHDLEEAKSSLDSSLMPAPASIAFRESMGYTIAQLESGASSHNNEHRPFRAVPMPLEGLAYTQVVACSVSPVEFEFRSPGKLYVLVGTDWEGQYAARAWLRDRAQREMIPPVTTSRNTSFEVWSLTGETGKRLAVPTQVMLVAGHLERA